MGRHTGETRRLAGEDGWGSGDTIALIVIFLLISLLIGMYIIRDLHSPRQRAANQASAVLSLRIINTAEATYVDTYKGRYSPSLAALGPPPEGTQPSAAAAGLVDSLLAGGGVKSGYRFTYAPGPPDKAGHIQSYAVTARPSVYGATGNRSYFTDQSGVIRMTSEDRSATATDSPLGG